MATILIEANQSLDGKSIQLPKGIVNKLKSNNQIIDKTSSNDQYKKLDGYKRNQRITNNDYNQHSDNTSKAGIITYNDLVKWKHDLDHMSHDKNNISYQLNGGDEANSFVNNSLNHLRNSVKKENEVKKSENIKKSNLKPKSKPTNLIKVDNNSIYVHEEKIYNLIKNVIDDFFKENQMF